MHVLFVCQPCFYLSVFISQQPAGLLIKTQLLTLEARPPELEVSSSLLTLCSPQTTQSWQKSYTHDLLPHAMVPVWTPPLSPDWCKDLENQCPLSSVSLNRMHHSRCVSTSSELRGLFVHSVQCFFSSTGMLFMSVFVGWGFSGFLSLSAYLKLTVDSLHWPQLLPADSSEVSLTGAYLVRP